MGGSLAVAVKRAVTSGLKTYLAGLPDFNGATSADRITEVAYDFWQVQDFTERLFCGHATGLTPPAAMRSGRNFRDEAADFDLVLQVLYHGGSVEDAEVRALAIGAEVESWLADRKSNELGVAGLTSLTCVSWELASAMNNHGALAQITYKVHWTARLT